MNICKQPAAFRKKIYNLWYYHKLLLGITLLILFFIIYFIIPYIHGFSQNTRLSIAIINGNALCSTEKETLEKDLLAALSLNDPHDHIQIDTSVSTSDNNSATVIHTAIAMSAISENDLVICNESAYRKYAAQGAFLNLQTELQPANTFDADILATDYAFDLSKSPVWRAFSFTDYSPVYACILKEAPHKEQLPKLITYLFYNYI